MRPVSRRKIVLGTGLALALIVGGPFGLFLASDNFGVIQPGKIYRSAQMSGPSLSRTIQDRSIKTVLNLRGPNPKQAWYRAELATTLQARATQVDLPLATDQYLTVAQAQMIVEVLDHCDKPVLIHCQFGSERTGLVAVFAELLRDGSTLKDARDQLSIQYKFLAIKDGVVVLGHYTQYENYLKLHQWNHSTRIFRHYIAEDYRPAGPSRDDWPFNPIPLVVIHRPEGVKTVGQVDPVSTKK